MRVRFRPVAAVAAFAACAAAPYAHAQTTITPAEARAAIAPFYDALNAAPGKDAAALVASATTADFVSCGGNEACSPRDKVMAGIAGLGKAVPDLKWEIKEVLVSGDRVTVRGEASGTPAGPFMGVPHGGKSFRVMSIDVHTIRDGKIARAYHVEDWMGASRQLAAK
jgi:predicted ester cyclase